MIDERVAKRVGLVPARGFKFKGTLAQFREAFKLQENVDELFENEVDLALREERNEEN